jgi:hypothetical protein
MSAEFNYDVFLSHSSKNKAVVRPLAERLREAGLRLWFDEWVLRPGDSIPARIDPASLGSFGATREGSERSRVLACPAEAAARRRMLRMSPNPFGSDSDWSGLESGTFRFREMLNKERHVPLLRRKVPAASI